MKRKDLIFAVTACISIMLSGCTKALLGAQSATSSVTEQQQTDVLVEDTINLAFTTSDDDYYFNWKVQDYQSFNLENGLVTIEKSGIYELYGTLKDGNVTVNVDKSVDSGTVFLVLNTAVINSSGGTPINVIEAKKVTVILETGTKNTINQGQISTDDSDFPTAALFSKTDTAITGSGTLNIITKYNDGICSKDNLVITDGTINIDAVGDGIVGKDILAIEKADITILAGKDGMRSANDTDADKGNVIISDGSFNITAQNDAIQSQNILQIDDGNFTLVAGGGYSGIIKQSRFQNGTGGRGTTTTTAVDTTSKKGIKAENKMVINGGDFNLNVYEDAINSGDKLDISGGSFNITAGDDAVHSDTAITINGADINIINCYEGIESLNITINGGDITINAGDDGVNISDRSGTLTIGGGKLVITAIGDGIDSNGNIVQTGGNVVINTTTISAGNNAVDYDGTFSGSGGTIVDQDGNTINHSAGGMQPGGMGGRRGGGGTPPADGFVSGGGSVAEPAAVTYGGLS